MPGCIVVMLIITAMIAIMYLLFVIGTLGKILNVIYDKFNLRYCKGKEYSNIILKLSKLFLKDKEKAKDITRSCIENMDISNKKRFINIIEDFSKYTDITIYKIRISKNNYILDYGVISDIIIQSFSKKVVKISIDNYEYELIYKLIYDAFLDGMKDTNIKISKENLDTVVKSLTNYYNN